MTTHSIGMLHALPLHLASAAVSSLLLWCAGLGLQALQQAAGINTVMYFAPSILGLAGFQSPRSAVLASIIPAGVNALGTIVGMQLIDRAGRRCELCHVFH